MVSDMPNTNRKARPKRRVAVAASPKRAPVLVTLRKCPKTFVKAHDFRSLLELIREAERRLLACGLDDVEEHISILRGLYYGTEWSVDFKTEKSEARNVGFRLFTATPTDVMDPTAQFDCGLFDALQASQDAIERGRQFDFGHAIIGIDCRRKVASRLMNIPFNGGTGLELCTWLGDLGGGAAMLAVDRGMNPSAPVQRRFSGSDFGGAINIEGDVAGFVVGHPSGVAGSPAAAAIAMGGIADAFERYLGLTQPSTEWLERAKTFLAIYGGRLSGATLSNRADLIDRFSGQIESFAENYIALRFANKDVTAGRLRSAAVHLKGCAREVAEVFVDALVFSATHGSVEISARRPVPAPSPPGSSNLKLLALAATAGN